MTVDADLPTEEPHSIEAVQTPFTFHAAHEETKRKQKPWDKTGNRHESVFGEALKQDKGRSHG